MPEWGRPKPTTDLLRARVHAVTLHRFDQCRAMARALGKPHTSDCLLAEALERLQRALRDQCRKKGVEWRTPEEVQREEEWDRFAAEDRRPMIFE